MATASKKEARKLVPLREGMFQMPRSLNGTPKLYGQRCSSCGEVFANQRVYCANCCQETLERVTLGTTGEVATYTIVRQQLRGSFITVPYVLARVRLPDGVTVQTILTDVEPDDVAIGMPVQICLREVTEDDDGNAVVNFFFKPAKTRKGAAA